METTMAEVEVATAETNEDIGLNMITRKIQLNITGTKPEIKAWYAKLYEWNNIVFRSANYISTHLYFQENMKEFVYLNEDYKIKLADRLKDEMGILNTSKLNSTYRLLSDKFKGSIPTAILSSINSIVVKNFNSDKKDLFKGARSLRTYKKTLPIPFTALQITDIVKTDDAGKEKNNYCFRICGIPLKTYFGKDLSGNRIIFERSLKGEYKLCGSSIQLKGNKIFLLAVFSFEKQPVTINPKNSCACSLSIDSPIIINFKDREWKIGTREDFMHKRLAIQAGLQRAQKAARENKGGHGRVAKMQSIERFEASERNYIQTKMHTYAHRLIEYCLKNQIGTINIVNIKTIIEDTEAVPFLLRNWSYGNLLQKIEYKAKKFGILVNVPES